MLGALHSVDNRLGKSTQEQGRRCRTPHSFAASFSEGGVFYSKIPMVRSAWMSPATARSATAAAMVEFTLPIEGMLTTLATASNESLARVAVDQRRRSLLCSDLAAETMPSPNTTSLIPMVRRSNSEAPVGSSRRDSRKKGPGHAISAAPTPVLSHPIRVATVWVTGAAYRVQGWSRSRRLSAGPKSAITIRS